MNNIFVINQKHDVDKKNNIIKLFDRYGLSYEVNSAVIGNNLDDNEIRSFVDNKKAVMEIGRKLTNGEIGCALSHMEIYKTIIDNNLPYAVIFEDDVYFDASITEVIDSLDRLPEFWGCVLFCYYRNQYYKKNYIINHRSKEKISKSYSVARFIRPMHSTAAYAVSYSGAVQLLDLLQKGIYKPIDHYTGDEQHVNLYGIYPRPVFIDTKYGMLSSIASERNVRIKGKGGSVKGESIRRVLKKYKLFKLFKTTNIFRQKIQFSFEHILYTLCHLIEACSVPKLFTSDSKTVLIISPEKWSEHSVSKHHYARVLAERGCTVLFLNPFEEEAKSIRLEQISHSSNIYVVSSPKVCRGLRYFPAKIRNKLESNWLIKLERKIQKKIDLVWLFENSRFFDMRFAGKRSKVYHQVDLNQDFNHGCAARTADICFCSSEYIREILVKYNRRCYKIHHGTASMEIDRDLNTDEAAYFSNDAVNVVYIGNLDISYLDVDLLATVVSENPDVRFHFVGGYSNFGKIYSVTKRLSNIAWWGQVHSSLIPAILTKADVLLVAYLNDYYEQVSSPHKFMEYFASGKTIVSTHTAEYIDKQYLLEMEFTNDDYLRKFSEVIRNLKEFNHPDKKRKRIEFAIDNTYDKQLSRIEKLCKSHQINLFS